MDSSLASHTIVVTGAAGFVGTHLVRRLCRDHHVVGWYRSGSPVPDPTEGVEWLAVDLSNRESVHRAIAMHAPAQVYHLGGAASVATSWGHAVLHLKVNALGTHHVLDAIGRTHSPCRVLVVSSAEIYRASEDALREDSAIAPRLPYGLSKLAADELALRAVRDESMDVVVARPFNHIGPGQSPAYAVSSFARQIARIEAGLEPSRLRVGNLDARRDVTDVRDVVDAYIALMRAGRTGTPYNICSGRAWRMRDLLDELLHLTQVRVEVQVDPTQLRPADVPIVHGDSSRIRAELGWSPSIRVEQTLVDTITWWRRQTGPGS